MADIIHNYVQNWMPHDKQLLPFYIGVDNFLEEHLTGDSQDLEQTSPKIIADPLLGYIHLSPLEIAIVDTKLFQRLRKIRQLGLAFLVFPTLGYTRFEHSLGVLGRLNQILNKLQENNKRRNSNDNSIKTVVEQFDKSIRLAALLHDVGHCLFSHCSERVIEQAPGSETYPSASEIQLLFRKCFPEDHILDDKKPTIPFAELFSIAIIGSKRFFNFLENLNFSNKREIEKMLRHTARFILGMPAEGRPDTIFLSQLISSGLDADKIDYMLREQHYSGIKLEIDIDRILSKLCVFDLKVYELPKQQDYLKKHFDPETSFKVMGFEKGGQFAFEEFCVARLALHVKVYMHQKVRAAEAQFEKYLQGLLNSPILAEVHNWLKLPETIVDYPELVNQKFSYDGTLFNNFGLNTKNIACFKKIDGRDIVHRAFGFGPINSYSEGVTHADTANSKKLDSYFNVYKDFDLRKAILEEAIRIGDEYQIEFDQELLDEVIIDLPRLLNIQQGQESIHFERASYLPVRWTIPIDKILIYYQENRALAYVFSPKQISHIISVAAEIIVFNLSGKVYSQEGHLSKVPFLEYLKLKQELTAKNYFKLLPQLKPISDYLKKAEASEKISSVHENLKAFKSLNDEHITIERITTFANQFPEHLQDACLSFLLQLKVYNESLLADELDKVLAKAKKENVNYALCPLGAATDSANRMYYHLRTVSEKYQIEKQILTDNTITESDELILFDDNINSGLQVLNIFAELLQLKEQLPDPLLLKEKHNLKLVSEEAKLKLRTMPINIVYIVGYEGAEEKIKNLLQEHLGFQKERITIRISHLLYDDQKIFSGSDSKFGHDKKPELKAALSEIGEKLLRNEGKEETKIQSCKLGYANAEAMVLFPYNIPTMTITALWCRGEVDSIPWIPLMERRRRTDKEGQFVGED